MADQENNQSKEQKPEIMDFGNGLELQVLGRNKRGEPMVSFNDMLFSKAFTAGDQFDLKSLKEFADKNKLEMVLDNPDEFLERRKDIAYTNSGNPKMLSDDLATAKRVYRYLGKGASRVPIKSAYETGIPYLDAMSDRKAFLEPSDRALLKKNIKHGWTDSPIGENIQIFHEDQVASAKKGYLNKKGEWVDDPEFETNTNDLVLDKDIHGNDIWREQHDGEWSRSADLKRYDWTGGDRTMGGSNIFGSIARGLVQGVGSLSAEGVGSFVQMVAPYVESGPAGIALLKANMDNPDKWYNRFGNRMHNIGAKMNNANKDEEDLKGVHGWTFGLSSGICQIAGVMLPSYGAAAIGKLAGAAAIASKIGQNASMAILSSAAAAGDMEDLKALGLTNSEIQSAYWASFAANFISEKITASAIENPLKFAELRRATDATIKEMVGKEGLQVLGKKGKLNAMAIGLRDAYAKLDYSRAGVLVKGMTDEAMEEFYAAVGNYAWKETTARQMAVNTANEHLEMLDTWEVSERNGKYYKKNKLTGEESIASKDFFYAYNDSANRKGMYETIVNQGGWYTKDSYAIDDVWKEMIVAGVAAGPMGFLSPVAKRRSEKERAIEQAFDELADPSAADRLRSRYDKLKGTIFAPSTTEDEDGNPTPYAGDDSQFEKRWSAIRGEIDQYKMLISKYGLGKAEVVRAIAGDKRIALEAVKTIEEREALMAKEELTEDEQKQLERLSQDVDYFIKPSSETKVLSNGETVPVRFSEAVHDNFLEGALAFERYIQDFYDADSEKDIDKMNKIVNAMGKNDKERANELYISLREDVGKRIPAVLRAVANQQQLQQMMDKYRNLGSLELFKENQSALREKYASAIENLRQAQAATNQAVTDALPLISEFTQQFHSVNSLGFDIDNSEKVVEESKRQLEKHDDTLAEFDKQVNDIRTKQIANEEAQNDLNEKIEKERAGITDENRADVEPRIAQMEAEVENLRNKHIVLSQQTNDLQKERNDVSTERDEFVAKHNALTLEHEQKKQSYRNEASKLNDPRYDDAFNAVSATTRMIRGQLSDLEAQVSNINSAVESMMEDDPMGFERQRPELAQPLSRFSSMRIGNISAVDEMNDEPSGSDVNTAKVKAIFEHFTGIPFGSQDEIVMRIENKEMLDKAENGLAEMGMYLFQLSTMANDIETNFNGKKKRIDTKQFNNDVKEFSILSADDLVSLKDHYNEFVNAIRLAAEKVNNTKNVIDSARFTRNLSLAASGIYSMIYLELHGPEGFKLEGVSLIAIRNQIVKFIQDNIDTSFAYDENTWDMNTALRLISEKYQAQDTSDEYKKSAKEFLYTLGAAVAKGRFAIEAQKDLFTEDYFKEFRSKMKAALNMNFVTAYDEMLDYANDMKDGSSLNLGTKHGNGMFSQGASHDEKNASVAAMLTYIVTSLDMTPEVYRTIENVVSQVTYGDPAMTIEQMNIAVELVGFYLHDRKTGMNGNEEVVQTINDAKRSARFHSSSMMVRGYAGGGKTQVLMANVLKVISELKGSPVTVTVVAPRMDVGWLSANTIGGADVITYHDLIVKGVKPTSDILIMDEASLLPAGALDIIKANFEGKATIFFIGDESQTPSSSMDETKKGTGLTKFSQECRRVALRSTPIEETHRSSLTILKLLYDHLRFDQKGAMIDGEYYGKDGVPESGLYFARSQNAVEQAFLDDTSDSKMIVFETEAEARIFFEANKSKGISKEQVLSARFDISNENSLCCSGLSAEKVYVAIGAESVGGGTNNEVKNYKRMLYTAASRAKWENALVMMYHSSAVNNQKNYLSGYEVNPEEARNRNSHQKDETLEQLKAINGDVQEPKKKDPPVEKKEPKVEKEVKPSVVETPETPVVLGRRFRTLTEIGKSMLSAHPAVARLIGNVASVINSSKNDLQDLDADVEHNKIVRLAVEFMLNPSYSYNQAKDTLVAQIERYNSTMGEGAGIASPEAYAEAMLKNRKLQDIVHEIRSRMDKGTTINSPAIAYDGKAISVLGVTVVGVNPDGKPVVEVYDIGVFNNISFAKGYSEMTPDKAVEDGGMNEYARERYASIVKALQEQGAVVSEVTVFPVSYTFDRGTNVDLHNPLVIENVATLSNRVNVEHFDEANQYDFEVYPDDTTMEWFKQEVGADPSAFLYNDNGRIVEAELVMRNGLRMFKGEDLMVEHTPESAQNIIGSSKSYYMFMEGAVLNESNQIVLGTDLRTLENGFANIEDSLSNEDRRIRLEVMSILAEASQSLIKPILMATYHETFDNYSRINGERKPQKHAIVYTLNYAWLDSTTQDRLAKAGATKEWLSSHPIAIESAPEYDFTGRYASGKKVFSQFGEAVDTNMEQMFEKAIYAKDHNEMERWLNYIFNGAFPAETNPTIKQQLIDYNKDKIRRIWNLRNGLFEYQVEMSNAGSGKPVDSSSNIPMDQFEESLSNDGAAVVNRKPVKLDNGKYGISVSRPGMDPTVVHVQSAMLNNLNEEDRATLLGSLNNDIQALKNLEKDIKELMDSNGNAEEIYTLMEAAHAILDNNILVSMLHLNITKLEDTFGIGRFQYFYLDHEVKPGRKPNIRLLRTKDFSYSERLERLIPIAKEMQDSNSKFENYIVPFNGQMGGREVMVSGESLGMPNLTGSFKRIENATVEADSNDETFINISDISEDEASMFMNPLSGIDLNDPYYRTQDSKVDDFNLTPEDAANEVMSIIGQRMESGHRVIFADDLFGANGERLYGMLKKLNVYLYTTNGKASSQVARHEAMHFIHSYLLNEKSKKAILKELEEKHGTSNIKHLYEYLAEGFEKNNAKPKTMLGKIVAAVKHLLSMFNLYSYTVDEVYKAANLGLFRLSPIQRNGQEDEYHKKRDRYNNHSYLIKVFGSVESVKALQGIVKRDLRMRSGIDSKVDRYEEISSTMAGAIYNVVNEYSNSETNVDNRKAYAKRNNIKVSPNDPMLLYRRELGSLMVTLKDGSKKQIKNITFEEIKGSENEKLVNDYYLRYHMSNGYVIKTFINSILPGVNIDKVIEGYRHSRKVNKENMELSGVVQGATTRNVIQGEMDSNEKKKVGESLSPYIQMMLETIKVRTNRFDFNTMSISVADFKAFYGINDSSNNYAPVVSYSALTQAMYEAGLKVNERLSSVSLSTMPEEDRISIFFEELENIAKVTTGTVGAFIRSFLIEYGNVRYNVSSTWNFKHWPGGLMTMVNPSTRKEILEKLASGVKNQSGGVARIKPEDLNKIATVAEQKASTILKDFIIPMVNHFTGVAAINLSMVVSNGKESNYICNETTDRAAIKASMADGVKEVLLGEDGLLSDIGMDVAAKITIGNNTLSFNGKQLVNGNKTIPANVTGEDIHDFLTSIGIGVSQKTVDDILVSARSENPISVRAYGNSAVTWGKFSLDILGRELYAMGMAVKVNGMVQDDIFDVTESKSLNKAMKSATSVLYGKMNSEYKALGYSMVSPYEAVYGEAGAAMYATENGVTISDFFIPSPSQHFIFIKALSEVESNSLGTGYEIAKKNVNDDTIQKYVKSSLFMDMFQGGSQKVLNSLIKVRDTMLNLSKQAEVAAKRIVDSGVDATVDKLMAARSFIKRSINVTLDGKIISIFENSDTHYQAVLRQVDFWGGEKGTFKGVEFASQSPKELFRNVFEIAFFQNFLSGKKGNIFPMDQIADKTKMNFFNLQFNYTRKNSANMTEEVKLFSIEKKGKENEAVVNVPLVVSLMKTTCERYANIQRLSLVRWATELNRVAPSEELQQIANGIFTSEDLSEKPTQWISTVKAAFEALDPVMQKQVVNNLPKNLDWVKGKNGFELGQATLLNAKNSAFDSQFVYSLLGSSNVSEAMEIMRNAHAEKYVAMATYLTESGYKMRSDIRNFLSENRKDYSELDKFFENEWKEFWKEEAKLPAEEFPATINGGRVTYDSYQKLTKEEKAELKSVITEGREEPTPFGKRFKATYDRINSEKANAARYFRARSLFEDEMLYDSIDPLTGEGMVIPKGTEVEKNGKKSRTRKEKQLMGMKTYEDIIRMSKSERNMFFMQNPRLKKAFDELSPKTNKSSDTDISSFIDTTGKWNPVAEAFYWGTMVANAEANSHTQGSELDTKDIVDYFKRNAGVNAPGDIGSMLPSTMSKQARVLIMDMGGATHPYATETKDGKRTLLYDPESRANGLGYLNPVYKIMMIRAFGRVNGPVGNAMVKPVLSYFDNDLGCAIYMKQALRHITGTTIQMSNQDLFLLRTMLGETIWADYGHDIINVSNGLDPSAFDDIMGQIADAFDIPDVDFRTMNQSEKQQYEAKIAKREKYLSEMLFQVIDPSAVKRGLLKVHKFDVPAGEEGKRDATGDGFEVLNAKDGEFDNAVSVDLSKMRVQLNIEQDVEDVDKNMAVQFKHMLGVMNSPENSVIANNVNRYMQQMQDLAMSKILGVKKDGTRTSVVEAIVKALHKKINFNDSLRDSKLLAIANLNLGVLRGKAISGFFSDLNKALKPKMTGNTYAQATIDVDLWEDAQTGRIYFKNELSGVAPEVVARLKKRKMQPMRYGIQTTNGMVYLEATRNGDEVVESIGEKVDKILALGNNESISGAELGIDVEHVTKNMLTTIPGDCMMPYSYFSKFFPSGTKNMSLNEALDWIETNRPDMLDAFKKTLTVLSIRIPVSNASSASVNRIVGFVNDMGNTYFMASEKNHIDGADQDIDTIHVYFPSLDANSMKSLEPMTEQDGEPVDEMDKEISFISVPDDTESMEGLRNNILSSYQQFLLDPANHEMAMRANSMDTLKEKAENSDIKNDNHYATEVGSSIHAKEINHDGKDVGFFADAQAIFSSIQSLVNIIGSKKVLQNGIISSKYSLLFNPNNHVKADAVDWLGKLINAATDNAKNNFLGRLNFNKRNSSVILGATASGMTEDQIYLLLNGAVGEGEEAISVAYDVDKAVKNTYGIDGFPQPLYVIAGAQVSEGNKGHNWDSIKAVLGVSDVLELFDSAILTEKEISLTDAADGVRLFLVDMALRGESLVRYKSIQKFVENIPVHTYDLKARFRTIEFNVGMSMEDLIDTVEKLMEDDNEWEGIDRNGVPRSIANEVAYAARNNRTTNAGDKFFTNETAIRGNIDIPMLLAAQPNVFNSLKTIYNNYKATARATVQDRLTVSATNLVESHLGHKIFSADALKDVEVQVERMVIGHYLSEQSVEINGNTFDLQDGTDRATFYYGFPDMVKEWKRQHKNNEFLNRISVDKATGDMREVGLRSSIGLDPISKGVLYNAYRQLPSDVQNAFMVYNIMRFGITTSKDSMSEVIGVDQEVKLSKFMDELDNQTDEQLEQMVQKNLYTMIVSSPATLTNGSGMVIKSKRDITEKGKRSAWTYMTNGFGMPNSTINLRYGQMNAYGVNGPTLAKDVTKMWRIRIEDAIAVSRTGKVSRDKSSIAFLLDLKGNNRKFITVLGDVVSASKIGKSGYTLTKEKIASTTSENNSELEIISCAIK